MATQNDNMTNANVTANETNEAATATAADTKLKAPRKPRSNAKGKGKGTTASKAADKPTQAEQKVSKPLPACLAPDAPYPSGNAIRRTFTAGCALATGLITVGKNGLVNRGQITKENVDAFTAATNGRAKPYKKSAWLDANDKPLSNKDSTAIANLQKAFAGKHPAGFNVHLELAHKVAGLIRSGKASRTKLIDPDGKREPFELILVTHPRAK